MSNESINMRRRRNLVAECYQAGMRKNITLSWEEMDKRSGGMISSFTYLVLFLNDQIYAADMELNEILPSDKGLYRGSVRKTYARLHKSVDSFQTVNNSYLGKETSYLIASVLSDVEEEMKPHIDNMYYAVSQILLDAGVSGNTNAVASKAAVMNMLCQVSRLMIAEFGNRILRMFGERDNRLLPPVARQARVPLVQPHGGGDTERHQDRPERRRAPGACLRDVQHQDALRQLFQQGD